MSSRALVALLMVALSVPVAAQSDGPPSGRIPTVSRLVMVFSRLELSLDHAFATNDAAAAAALLTPAFEQRDATAPGTPVPRAQWLAAMLGQPPRDARISQMAVHDFGPLAVVSFRMEYLPSVAAAAPVPLLVTDVWQQSGSDWHLAVRYAAAADSSTPVPGAPATVPAPRTTPSGKG